MPEVQKKYQTMTWSGDFAVNTNLIAFPVIGGVPSVTGVPEASSDDTVQIAIFTGEGVKFKVRVGSMGADNIDRIRLFINGVVDFDSGTGLALAEDTPFGVNLNCAIAEDDEIDIRLDKIGTANTPRIIASVVLRGV